MLRRYKLSDVVGALNATTSDFDDFTAQRKGRIKQIVFNTILDNITDNGRVTVQISRRSTHDYGAAGGAITDCIAEQSLSANFVTSGLAHLNGTTVINCDDPLEIGNVVYAHAIIAGTVVVYSQITLVIEEAA